MIRAFRTPEERFVNLPEYSFTPHYLNIPDERFGSLRMHYLEEGPADGPVLLLLHGQGSWAYLYRRMIPLLVARGFRVIVPDYIGFGRSDKLPSTEDYTFQRHIDWLTSFFDQMGLRNVSAYLFDWGGFFGLRIAAERPEIFGRIVLSNTMLPTGQGSGRDWFIKWREQQFALPRFPQGEMVNEGVVQKLAPEIIAAFDAPYPDETYKTGPRRFPMILPIQAEDPAAIANARAWDVLADWEKPVLTIYTAAFAGSAMGPERLLAHLPGAQGQPHTLLKDANFYLTEDQGADIARRIADFAS